jgi:hypothetical protein|tara:strand:- start:170 stop:409 length:240 start_codon:yes stop_codon:yes gene_type:complete
MCGIIAVVSFRNHKHNLSKLDEMASMIRRRGSDDEGFAMFTNNSNEYKMFYGNDTPEGVIKSTLNFLRNESSCFRGVLL